MTRNFPPLEQSLVSLKAFLRAVGTEAEFRSEKRDDGLIGGIVQPIQWRPMEEAWPGDSFGAAESQWRKSRGLRACKSFCVSQHEGYELVSSGMRFS